MAYELASLGSGGGMRISLRRTTTDTLRRHMMQRGAGILTGDSGRVIMVEYFVTITNVGYGLGEDNYGNIYRFIIRP